MTIEHIGADRTRAEGPGRSADIDRPDQKDRAPKAVRVAQGDQVEISVAGRGLAAGAAGPVPAGAAGVRRGTAHRPRRTGRPRAAPPRTDTHPGRLRPVLVEFFFFLAITQQPSSVPRDELVLPTQ